MRVYVVDNGGQWTHREWRVLKYLGAETKIVANDTQVSELDGLDGLVLSGGAPRSGWIRERWAGTGSTWTPSTRPSWESARDTSSWRSISGRRGPGQGPGVREVHGGSPPARHPVRRPAESVRGVGVPQRRGHPSSRGTSWPLRAPRTATSSDATPRPSLFGLQFHPEVEHTQFGADIFRNFLNSARVRSEAA